MKNLQQNLLILLAFCLCALCVYQWNGQTRQREQIQKLDQMVYDRSAAIQGYTNSLQTMDQQIAQLDAQITQAKQAAKTNDHLLILQKRKINKLETTTEGLTNQITEYRKAVDSLETKLKEAYEGIKKQNEAIKELVAQRDDVVRKLNNSVKERNDLVAKYNELAARIDKLQAGGAK